MILSNDNENDNKNNDNDNNNYNNNNNNNDKGVRVAKLSSAYALWKSLNNNLGRTSFSEPARMSTHSKPLLMKTWVSNLVQVIVIYGLPCFVPLHHVSLWINTMFQPKQQVQIETNCLQIN